MEHQFKQDIRTVLNHPQITRNCVVHLLANQHRLVRGVYHTLEGKGCFMNILTESLPHGQNIRSRNDLIHFFGVPQGKLGDPEYVNAYDSREYQPAKWIVRMIDRQVCTDIITRYGANASKLSEQAYEIILETCREWLAEQEQSEGITRTATEPQTATVTKTAQTAVS